jgi:N4-gp56 family major capsid protein
MALETAKSNTTTVSKAIKSAYYDKLFLRIAESKLVHKQLGQTNRKIESGEGGYGTGVVTWTKWVNLPLVTAGQGEGVPTTAVSMTATNVTGSTAQYDAAVSISDILAYVSFGDVMKAAMERLAYNAGLSIDTIVAKEIQNSGTFDTVVGGIATAAWTSVPATATMTIGGVRRAVRRLQRADTMQLEDGSWVSVIHPDSLYDLQADTTTGGWMDANKYTAENATKLLSGEVGKLMGVRFLSTTNASVPRTGVVASGSLYVTSFFGRDAFGVTELQSLKTYVKDFGSAGAGDPTDKLATAGWKTTFGAASLNGAFYVNMNHTVSTTA